ncbi:MAG: putative S-adenosylmethionine:tRNA ribosyltransferase-isomerase [Myxococcales bacterium]|nr:putative S-adenosylmethionine:tRNA ribosyltransferase-isomerase [Myxococcales bacterium]
MKPAAAPRPRIERRLLTLDRASGVVGEAQLDDLPSLLRAGDLLVVNDAATLPASLPARTPSGAAAEVRLVRARDDGRRWQAVLFGPGDWRTPTEHRAAPEPLAAGLRLEIAGLPAVVVAISRTSVRLFELRFETGVDEVWSAIYRRGRPIQYAHVPEPLALWSVQTSFAGRPWAAEAPSAGVPLDWSLLLRLRARGVALAAITEGAGLSATGDPAIDDALPLPERFEVPAATASAIAAAHARDGRVVAVGTSVVRALESAAAAGVVRPCAGETDLLIGPGYQLRAVDGLFTGLHEPTASHYALLQAFASRAQLDGAYAHAERGGYLGHEFGDANLIL